MRKGSVRGRKQELFQEKESDLTLLYSQPPASACILLCTVTSTYDKQIQTLSLLPFFFSVFFSLLSSSLSFFHGQNISKIGRTYLLLGGAEDYLRCYKRSSFNVSWLEIENNHMEVIMIQRECMEGIWRHCTMPGLFQNMVCIFYFFLLNLKIPQNDILSFIIFITITFMTIWRTEGTV